MLHDGTEIMNAAIVGSGNIGTDLAMKLLRNPRVKLAAFVGVDPGSEGLRRLAAMGVTVSAEGVDWLLEQDELPDVVFEATSAYAHRENAPRYEDAGVRAIDLTPAALGPLVVPAVNLDSVRDSPNVNLISCGGQATIPIVAAVTRVEPVPYAEIVASVASRSAGPGTRANIDEFTQTTSKGIEQVGGAERGRAIMILNPAEPPITMRNTVFCAIGPDADRNEIAESIRHMAETVQEYVPGYELLAEPQFDDPAPDWDGNARVTVMLQVRGAGDFLPEHAGNLDIMTAAAAAVGERLGRVRAVVE